MSVTHLGLVLDHLHVKPAVKLVAVVLADHADRDGLCWPSYRRIAERSGLDERTVRRHVKVLLDLGVIEKLRTGTMAQVGDRFVHVTNLYRFNEDRLRRFPMLVSSKLSTEGLGISDEFVHPGVVKNTHLGWGQLSTKSSINHQPNRKRSEAVDNSDGTPIGEVLGSLIQDGTIG